MLATLQYKKRLGGTRSSIVAVLTSGDGRRWGNKKVCPLACGYGAIKGLQGRHHVDGYGLGIVKRTNAGGPSFTRISTARMLAR